MSTGSDKAGRGEEGDSLPVTLLRAAITLQPGADPTAEADTDPETARPFISIELGATCTLWTARPRPDGGVAFTQERAAEGGVPLSLTQAALLRDRLTEALAGAGSPPGDATPGAASTA